jgi:Gpi18-like mannosyltransferase
VFWSWLGSRLLFFLTLALALRPRTAAELIERLGQWDGAHYLRIAAQGYGGDEFAFFPLFPYTIKAVAALVPIPPVLVALLLVNIALLGALLVLYRLSERCLGAAIARNVVLLTCLNPMAIFLAIPYTESFYLLFTALTLAALVRRPTGPGGLLGGGLGGLAAGLWGGLAAAKATILKSLL